MALGLKLASRAALFGCCCLAAMASAAQAAEAPPTETRLEELVVTAQRTEQNLQSVPVAETALDQAALEKHNVTNVEDLQFHVPNVLVSEASATGGLTIGIRGINVAADNFAFDSAVGVYVNDVFIARANDFGSTFYDVHGVQVLRGPQGTFFGRDTPAGAVLIETNAPGSTFGGYVTAQVGGGGHGLGDGADRNIYRLDAAVDLPISSILSMRLAGYYLNDDGWGRSTFNGHKFYSSNDGAVRATLEFRPTDRFNARLVLDHSNLDHGGPLLKVLRFTPPSLQPYDTLHGGTAARDQITAQVLTNTDPYSNASPITQGLKGEASSASLRMNYEISDAWHIRSITGWRQTKRDQLDDNIGIPLQIGFTSANLRQEQFSQEVVLAGAIFEQLHFVGGLYYFQETGSDQNTIGAQVQRPNTPQAFIDPLNLRGEDVKNTSKAAFANLSYDILPTLTASFGYRISQEDKHVLLNSRFLVSGIPLAVGPQNFSDKVPLYDGKLTWKATPDLLLYAKYGTGYRAGGIGFRAANAEFGPETDKTYEVGAKWDFNIGSAPARLNAAAFDTAYKNFQTQVVLLNPTRQTVINAGGAIFKGAEFEFSVKPTSNLDLSASVGLLDAKYQTFVFANATAPGGVVNLTGQTPPNAPKVNATLSAGYTVASKIGEWLFQGDYAYTSHYGLGNASVFQQDATAIVNARVRLREPFGSKVDVSLWAKNLTDEKVLTFALTAGTLSEATYAQPLSYGVDLHVPF